MISFLDLILFQVEEDLISSNISEQKSNQRTIKIKCCQTFVSRVLLKPPQIIVYQILRNTNTLYQNNTKQFIHQKSKI